MSFPEATETTARAETVGITKDELIDQGEGIHWSSIDEDISIEGVLEGRRSCESEDSVRQWLTKRK